MYSRFTAAFARVVPPRARAAAGGIALTMAAMHFMQINGKPAQAQAADTSAQRATRPAATIAPTAVAADSADNGPSTYAVSLDLERPLDPRPSELALRGLVVVTRHGARTPMSRLPGDAESRKAEFAQTWGLCPLGDHTALPCRYGMLTALGELQLNSVGWWMKQQYTHRDSFFPAQFDSSFFALRSTDLPRTQLTLLRLMQGIYPGLPMSTVAPQVEVRKQAEETLYPNHYHCPRLKELYIDACHASKQADASVPAAVYRSIADAPEALALRGRFASALGTTPEALGTWVVIGDELKCRQAARAPLVAGVTQAMSDRANELAEETFWHIMRGGAPADHAALRPASMDDASLLSKPKSALESEVTRLGMGRMMQEMFGGLDAIRATHDNAAGSASSALVAASADDGSKALPRCLIYSGHDTTIAPLLASLHATHALMTPRHAAPGWPVFASNMMMELLEEVQPASAAAAGTTAAAAATASAAQDESRRLPKHLGREDSMAPLPPTFVEDDEHSLPTEGAAAKTAADSAAAQTVAAPRSKWFLRLLVDHKQVSLLPYDAYQTVRDAYQVRDWLAECKQKGDAPLPAHQW